MSAIIVVKPRRKPFGGLKTPSSELATSSYNLQKQHFSCPPSASVVFLYHPSFPTHLHSKADSVDSLIPYLCGFYVV